MKGRAGRAAAGGAGESGRPEGTAADAPVGGGAGSGESGSAGSGSAESTAEAGSARGVGTGGGSVGSAGLLYRGAGLLFLLGLFLVYFDPIARVLLLGFVASIIAVALNKLVERLPLRRAIAAPLAAVVLLGGIGVVVYFLGAEVARQLDLFMQQLPDLWGSVQEWQGELREETGLDVSIVGERAVEVVRDLPNVLRQAIGLLEVVALVLLVMIGAFFVAAEPNERLLTPLMRAIPRAQRPAWYRVLRLLGDRLGGWLWGSLISMIIIGTVSTAALYLLGAPYSLLLGVTMGLLEAVPMVGPWIGGILAVLVTLLHDPGLAIWVALAVLVIQQLEGNVIFPMVMRGTVAVHPFVTLMALILFSSMFGLLGAVLAVPLVLALQTFIHVFWIEERLGAEDDVIDPVVRD